MKILNAATRPNHSRQDASLCKMNSKQNVFFFSQRRFDYNTFSKKLCSRKSLSCSFGGGKTLQNEE